MRLLSRALVTGLAAGAAVLAFTLGSTLAPSDAADTKSVADGSPAYAVEDFEYPQSDKILEERGFLLKRGDGHIVLTKCGAEGLIHVQARKQSEDICFRVTGDEGYLSLEIPQVYLIRGNDYDTQVNTTVDDEKKSFDINKNAWTAVGESADPEGRDHMLVEIITSK